MGTKKHKPEEVVVKLQQVDVLVPPVLRGAPSRCFLGRDRTLPLRVPGDPGLRIRVMAQGRWTSFGFAAEGRPQPEGLEGPMTDKLHGCWRIAAAAATLAGSPASAGPARDPISYIAFCHRHFEALDAWNRC